MESRAILESLLYLDRDFIAGAYEVLKGHAPLTQVTKNEGASAGAKIPFFSAGLSASETRSFSVSTFGMLIQMLPELRRYPPLAVPAVREGARSVIGWIEGELSVFRVVIERGSKDVDQKKKSCDATSISETYFAIQCLQPRLQIALITTPDYFSSGLGALLQLYDTVLEHVSIPVRALVRVYDAQSSFKEWIAVPLVIYEHEQDARLGPR